MDMMNNDVIENLIIFLTETGDTLYQLDKTLLLISRG